MTVLGRDFKHQYKSNIFHKIFLTFLYKFFFRNFSELHCKIALFQDAVIQKKENIHKNKDQHFF